MTSTETFAKQAEPELRQNRKLSASTCKLLSDLDDQGRAVFARALEFICERPDYISSGIDRALSTRRVDRWAASRLMLLKFRADTSDPVWSSFALSRYVHAVMSVPGASLEDVFGPLFCLLGEAGTELTPPVAHLVKDLVIYCFGTFRSAYESVVWHSIAQAMDGQPTHAQSYLALHAIPPEFMTPEIAATIENALAPTEYAKEAEAVLAE